jgi:hypothetical protein
MQITCPHCAHTDSDGLGLLNEEEVHALKCGGCGGQFHCFIHDCESCLHESVFSWASAPSHIALALLHCECCAKPVVAQALVLDSHCDINILIGSGTPSPSLTVMNGGGLQ